MFSIASDVKKDHWKDTPMTWLYIDRKMYKYELDRRKDPILQGF